MARARTRIPLNLFINGRLIGRLRRQTSGAIEGVRRRLRYVEHATL